MAVVFGESIPTRVSSNVPALPQAEKRNHAPFLLMVHAEHYRWDVVEQDWLIELGRLTISGGVGGVGIDANGRETPGLAIAYRQQQGWQVIHDGDARLSDAKFGTPGGKYLARHPANPHGFAVSFAWEGYERVRANIEWGEDRARRVQFQRALESTGLVPAMGQKLMEMDIRDATARVRRLGDKLARNPAFPSIRMRAEEAETMLTHMNLAKDKRLNKAVGKGK